MKIKTIVATLALIAFTAAPAVAQFEGEINYMVYYPQESEDQRLNVDLSITKDRVFVRSNATMDVMAGLKTTGVLVRNDHQDFVLMTGDGDGIQVKKSELDNIVDLLNRVQGNQSSADRPGFRWDERVEETGNTREIQGYETSEFRLKGDNEHEYVSVWLTDQIKINWGLLLDAWYDAGADQFDEDIPIELVMNNYSFPLLVEAYRNGETVMRGSVTSVDTGDVDRSRTEIPSDVKILGITDIMMNMFMQNR